MAGFDRRCPHCDAELCCEEEWNNHEHAHTFHIVCGCGKRVEVEVSYDPVFCTSKAMCCKCHRREPAGMYYCSKCEIEIREYETKSK